MSEEFSEITVDSLLSAIFEASGEAWCYIPSRADGRLRHSPEFLRLLNLPQHTTIASLQSSDLQAAMHRIGLEPHDIEQLCQPPSAPMYEEGTSVHTFDDLRVTRRCIGSPGGIQGVLLLFQLEDMALALHSAWHRALDARQQLASLSNRESQILRFVSKGLTNRATAFQMNISEKTVEKHRASIMRKLAVRTSADLIRCFTEASLLDDDTDSGTGETSTDPVSW